MRVWQEIITNSMTINCRRLSPWLSRSCMLSAAPRAPPLRVDRVTLVGIDDLGFLDLTRTCPVLFTRMLGLLQ